MRREKIIWNVDNINRLWAYYASLDMDGTNYFGYQAGMAIVHLCSFFVDNLQECEVLDYGSGMGHIIERFLDKKVNISGVDMSKEEVEIVNRKYSGNPYFHGVKLFDGKALPFKDDNFSLITCTECIEHILPEHMDNLLDELYRVLKPGGVILFTTPNEEELRKEEMCCPECNTIFHKYGHVSTFSAKSLTGLIEKHNYETILCATTDFLHIQRYLSKRPPLMDMTLRQILTRIDRKRLRILDWKHKKASDSKLFKKYITLNRRPHLFYVGAKSIR